MRQSCRIALLVIPFSLAIAVAIIQLDHLQHNSSDQVNRYLPNATLLVIAHPDDESMFFGPILLNLLDSGKHVHILCLSTGSSDHLGTNGETRKQELNKVVRALEPNVSIKIVEDKRLVDGMNSIWSPDVITNHVMKYLKIAVEGPQIRGLISFDAYGVSGHQNHRDIHGALVLMQQNHRDLNLDYFYLNSINLFRKYLSFMDSIIVSLPSYLGVILSRTESQGFDGKNHLVLALNFKQNRRLRQLLNLHESQMVWFRKLYQLFSRYMFINDLTIT